MKCEFSIEHYSECLQLAKEQGYTIGRIRDWSKFNQDCEKYILLRHDIDFSIDYALDIACTELQNQVYSTYYILLQSEFYNPLSPHNVRLIRYLSDLGHEIGYHVNSNHMIEGEEKILEKITGKPIFSYSHHFPRQTPKPKVDDLYLNARDPMINVKFISDSCRNWREGCMCEHIGKVDKLEILTHPVWYAHETSTRDDAINKMHYDLRREVDKSIESFKDQIPYYLEHVVKQK